MLIGLRYLSLRYWLRHKGAFALAGLGVALGIAVWVAIQIANASVLGAFSASLDAVAGRANLQIRGGSSGLPDELLGEIIARGDPRVRATTPQISRTLYAPQLKTSLLVNGVDFFSQLDFRDSSLDNQLRDESGRNSRVPGRDTGGAIRFLLDPRAIAVSQELADKSNLKVGSPLELNIGPRVVTFKVATILTDEASGRAFGGDYVLLDIAAAQEVLGEIGHIDQIDLIVDDNKIDAVKTELQPLVPPDATISRPAQRGAQIGAMLGAFQLNLTALSSIAAFVGAFLIYNALASAVVRRRAEAGILRAVGAQRGQIMRLFLGEAAIIGFFGSLVGFGIGVILAKWTLSAVATTVSQLYLAVKARELFIPTWLLPASLLAGTIISVLAAIPAASEAASTTPRAALSGSSLHTLLENWAPRLFGGGVAALALAGVLCLPQVSGRSPLLGFVAAGATLGGVALMVPLLLNWFARVLRPFAQRFGGIAGALAADNLRRALNRSSLVIAALLVSLALTIGMNVMVGSFRNTVANWINGTISADIFVATSSGFSGERGPGLPPEVTQFAASLPGVSTVDKVRQAQVEIDGQPVTVFANDLPSLRTGQRVLRFVSTRDGAATALRDYLSGNAILVSERLANELKLRAGGVLKVPTPVGEKSFPISGVFYDYNPNSVFYLPLATYRKLWRDDQIDGLALYLQSGSGEEIKRQINDRFGAKYALALLPNKEIRKQVFETFDQTFAVTYALQLIAVVVAAIGVFDTLVSMMLERTTELAALRAMGASQAQIRAMALWEFALLGGVSWILGSFAGLLLAGEMIFVINRQFFGWTIFPSVEPMVFVQAFALALGAALGAGIFPARAAARRNLASALQRE